MSISVVVGGHSRNIGKTSAVAGIVSGLVEFPWVAVKITQYGHGVCSVNGKSCHCGDEEHRVAVLQETDRSGGTDTSRFLVAGAQKSYWIRTKQDMLFEAMPAIKRLLNDNSHVIFESNSLLRFMRPDVFLMMLDSRNSDFKPSAKRFLDRVDAFLTVSSEGSGWDGISMKLLKGKPVFPVSPPDFISPPAIEYVRDLCLKTKQG